MTNYFLVEFQDLSFEKQQEMIETIKAELLDEYRKEAEMGKYGKNFGRTEYKNMSWEEAFVREYSIDYMLWETDEEAKKFNWDLAVDRYAEDEAIKELEAAMYCNKVEVEI